MNGQAHGLLLWALFLVLRRTSDGFTLPQRLSPQSFGEGLPAVRPGIGFVDDAAVLLKLRPNAHADDGDAGGVEPERAMLGEQVQHEALGSLECLLLALFSSFSGDEIKLGHAHHDVLDLKRLEHDRLGQEDARCIIRRVLHVDIGSHHQHC